MQPRLPDFYLASSEGYGLEEPRKCFRIKRLRAQSGNDLLLIGVDPPLLGHVYGAPGVAIDKLILAARHEGTSLFPIQEWPAYVYVARLLVDQPEEVNTIQQENLQVIAWAELYKTENDASAHGIR